MKHLMSSLPGFLRKRLRVVTDLQEASSAMWCRKLLLSMQKVAPASVAFYGEFPLPGCTWPRTEGGFEARYAYCINNAEVNMSTGAVCVDGRVLAESVGDHLDAACSSVGTKLESMVRVLIGGRREFLGEQTVYVVLPSAPFFHFVVEQLASLIMTLREFPDASVVLREDVYHSYYRGFVELLEQAGIIRHKVLCTSNICKFPRYAFTARELDSGMFRHETVQVLKDTFVSKDNKTCRDRRIFLTRKGTRKFDNQTELEQCASENGLEVVDSENMSVKEQLLLFCSASLVVANHGAGLTNLLWCQAGTRVLEMFSPRCLNDCYFRLSSLCHLNYDCLIAKETKGFGCVESAEFLSALRKMKVE